MSPEDEIEAFEKDLNALVDRYRAEFNLTLAAAIGCLEIVKLQLYKEHTDE
jgi:hypothetical protein